jgi:hypothetical protein
LIFVYSPVKWQNMLPHIMTLPLLMKPTTQQCMIKADAYTNVDGLGKNIISGIVLDESENSDSVFKGLQLFGLDKLGARLMSDGGSAFPCAAAGANMIHILFTQHFQQDAFPSCGGMGTEVDLFERDALALIYKAFATEQLFDEVASSALEKYVQHASAVQNIRKIVELERKACQTFTGGS